MRHIKSYLILGVLFIIGCCLIGPNIYRTKPLVSVLIPVYNRASLLPLTLQSVLDQTERHFELICVDDGSTDQSFRVMQTFARADKRIRVLRHETNKGVGAARDTALKAAYGQYGALLDSDDFARPEWLEESLKFFKTHPDVTVVMPQRWGYQSDIHHILPQEDISFSFILYDNAARNIGNVFRISFVRAAHITYDAQLRTAEDYDFWSRILMAGGKFAPLNKRVVIFKDMYPHEQSWYNSMVQNRRAISNRLLSKFQVPAPIHENACAVYQFIEETYPLLFKPEELQAAKIIRGCFKDLLKEIPVYHPSWGKDRLLFKGTNRVYREQVASEEATIVRANSNQIQIAWDKWGQETFVRDENGVFVFQPHAF